MAKVIVTLGYNSYVLDTDKAIRVAEALSEAERYESKYHSAVGDVPSYNTHHIYSVEPNTSGNISIQILHGSAYNMYKLAGKPKD